MTNSSLYVSLPAVGRKVTLGAYTAGWKAAIANPDRTFRHGLNTPESCSGRFIRREYRRGMEDRINTRGKVEGASRPTLYANRWNTRNEHLPPYLMLSTVARTPGRLAVDELADLVADRFDVRFDDARREVETTIRIGWLRATGGRLALTRTGKRALRRRIVGQCSAA